ncbi:Clp protease N-terminal domain-containing protein [Actinopolymorpha pittospori]|uniref:ATP-dependent Clp protease ATP-binding subunit ClpC n=1 Tax=Actinopolymorpha pittospori TaxID=648752 RepID=A0A927MTS2_9ACTN|nr:ATP-dependent Clp protease ATP-binding subunit ClpC [Actinopolymorpha pittospori]
MALFERFTDGARRVVVLAQEEARQLGHNYIGTEHLLLGLMHEGSGEAARALAGAGLTLDGVREQVLALAPVPERPKPSGHIPFTPPAKTVMELALREALRLRHRYLGTEHLLLGLLQEGDGVAVVALRELGVDPVELRRAVLAELGERPGQTPPAGEHPGEHTPAESRTQVLAEMRATFDDNERLRGEVARLRALLLRHDIDPDEDAEQGQSGSGPA